MYTIANDGLEYRQFTHHHHSPSDTILNKMQSQQQPLTISQLDCRLMAVPIGLLLITNTFCQNTNKLKHIISTVSPKTKSPSSVLVKATCHGTLTMGTSYIFHVTIALMLQKPSSPQQMSSWPIDTYTLVGHNLPTLPQAGDMSHFTALMGPTILPTP